MQVKTIIGDMGEKLLELGQDVGQKAKTQVAGGIAQSAKKQVFGQSPTGQQGLKSNAAKKDTSVPQPQDLGKEQFAQMLGQAKSMAPKDLQTAKESAATKANQELTQLQQKIRNYQEIQKAIELHRQKEAQKIRPDIAGKPGQPSTPQEQMEKAKKEEEKAKKKKTLSASVSQFLGSHEQGKFAVG